SGTLWIFLKSSNSLPVGDTQNRHFTGWSLLLKMPCATCIGRRMRSPAGAGAALPSRDKAKTPPRTAMNSTLVGVVGGGTKVPGGNSACQEKELSLTCLGV